MKSPYLSEIEPNKPATATFVVLHKEIRQRKTGEPYLSLLLGDRTGEIEAKMWDNVADVMETFDRDDFVRVKGQIQIYNNRPQFTIHKMQRVDASEIDPTDFFPASRRDPEEMFAELRALMAGIRDPHLKALVDLFLDDPEIAARLKRAPAAKFIHHAYLGGLLEHILSLARLTQRVAGHYPAVDPDLLLAGVLLHDIGKIYELSYERSFGYTSEGQLLGHIAIGLRLLGEKLAQLPAFPPRLRTLLEHMILSHHGQLEFGSPKVPLFPEALLLHYLDDLDAKMECMRALIENDRQEESDWTGYSSSLERVVLKKLKYLAEGRAEEIEPSPARAAPPATPSAPGKESPAPASGGAPQAVPSTQPPAAQRTPPPPTPPPPRPPPPPPPGPRGPPPRGGVGGKGRGARR
ncbi:MAG: HD domain-containing protein, partial [Bryobacterales bacterium]|nr:HD domain-containing protein [Bryobacterales bacterium]